MLSPYAKRAFHRLPGLSVQTCLRRGFELQEENTPGETGVNPVDLLSRSVSYTFSFSMCTWTWGKGMLIPALSKRSLISSVICHFAARKSGELT